MALTIQNINDYLTSLDVKDTLQGTSFHLDTTNELGFDPKNLFDFFTATPYGQWTNKLPPNPNVVAEAIQRALDAVNTTPPTVGSDGQKYVFIDFTTFDYFAKDFWNQGIGPKLAKVVNLIPSDVNPIIRLIAGGPFHSDARFQDPKDKQQGWTLFRDLFWRNDVPMIQHPQARFYLGYYNPDLKALTASAAMPDWASQFEKELREYLVETQVPIKALSYFDNGFLKGLDFPGVPTISWNHSKIVAVNGARMTTGGNNLWDDYGNGKINIFDSAVKIQGDATIQAHKFVDTLSEYLNDIPIMDNASFRHSIQLARPSPTSAGDFGTETIPFFTSTTGTSNSGSKAILTVKNIGDHFPLGLRYPVLAINAIKDFLLQLAYMELSQNAEIVPMDMKMAIMNGIISDLSDTSLLPFLQKFNLTPAVWASKSSHLFAISKASSEIILAQQMIVNGDLSVAPGVSTLKAWLQTNLGVEWDEYIVPYDLISALCDGLIQIATNHPNDNTKGLYILLSTKNNEEGYSDPYSFTKFRQILLNLLAARLLPDGVTIADIEKRIFGKRIMKNQKEYGQHSKVVCVDRSLLFVGSDNIYPEYNEQHGVWIDSKPNIQAWHDNYFNGAWDRGVDVED